MNYQHVSYWRKRHNPQMVWLDENVKNVRQAAIEGSSTGLKMPSGKGRRLIIIHIAIEDGFVLNVKLIFQSNKTGDYHEKMNAEVYEKFGRILKIKNQDLSRLWIALSPLCRLVDF
ncbi:hypothetical protein NQ317_006449 [Molorchus minor]|uniref:Uncharacterized protein n=1 Tax=Molorchus minor TaxID=1323400 RepID=A0ABQ9IYQ2_9CUCU|nr:hypothetical protein NQ317_006449 [Molorchus minor]